MPKNDSFADKVVKSLSNIANDVIRPFLAGPEGEGSGTGFSQGVDNPGISGIAQTTMLKDIVIVPTAGTGNSVFSYSQIDFKLLAKQNSYANLDQSEIKVSVYNYGERVVGNDFDTPMLVMGGSWGGTTWAPSVNWGLGTNTAIGPGYIDYINGNGNLIYFKPASSSVYASLFNDVALYSNQSNKTITLRAFDTPIPGSPSVPSTTVVFGGSGASNTLQIEGSTVDAQNVNVRFRSPFSVSNSTTTDTLSLGLSSSASTGGTIYFSGGSRPKYVLTSESPSFSAGDIFYASGSGNTLVRVSIGNAGQALVVGSNNVPSWSNSFSASSLSVASANGNTTLYPVFLNATSSGSAVSIDTDFTVNPGNNIFTYSGQIRAGTSISTEVIQSPTNALQISSATGTSNRAAFVVLTDFSSTGKTVFRVDTFNDRVIVGQPLEGSINTATKFYVVGNIQLHASSNVITIGSATVLSNTTLGAGVTNVGTLRTGVWSATAITAHYGGTGLTTGASGHTTGSLLYANDSRTWSRLAPGSNGHILVSAGTANTPVYTDPITITVGTATTSTRSNSIDIFSTNSSSAHSLVLTTSSSSSTGTGLSTTDGISVNPNDNTIAATSFIGNLSGFANTANNIRVVDADAGNGDHWVLISTPDTGAGVAVSADSDFKFDPNLNQLSVPHITGSGFTATELTGEIQTVSQNKITSASALATVGTISSGTWKASSIGVTYGGTGSDLSGSGHTNRIPVVGSSAPFAMSTIDNGTSGHLMISRGVNQAPHFSNSTSASLTLSGDVSVGNLTITNGSRSTNPTGPNDLANKAYVDSISSGILPKGVVKYTTIAGIAGSYRKASAIANSDSDIGAFIISQNLTALDSEEEGFDPVGAYTPALGDRILVRHGVKGGFGSASDPYISFSSVPSFGSFGSSFIANGIYTISAVGGNGLSNWILTRDTSADENSELRNGTYVAVDLGSNFADYSFICNNTGQPSFGSTEITFIEFTTATEIIAGQGLVKSGGTIGMNIPLTGDQISNAYRVISIGGARSGSVGNSTWPTFTIQNDTALNTNITSTFTNKTNGFSLSGGNTSKTITVEDTFTVTGDRGLTITTADTLLSFAQGSDFDVIFGYDSGGSALKFDVSSSNIFSVSYGGNSGFGFTFNDTYATNTGFELSAIRNISSISAVGKFNLKSSLVGGLYSDIFFTHNGISQYQLSTNASTFTAGDLFYASASGHTHLARLTFGTGTGNSVLIRGSFQPTWGTINLASANFVSGILPISNGGSGSTAADFTNNSVVLYDSSNNKLRSAAGLTYIAGTALSVVGTVSASGNIFSGGNIVPLGTGTATQISYWSDTNTLTSSSTLTYIPNATSGAALTIAPTSTSATAVRINGANDSGNLLEVMKTGTNRFSVDYEGNVTLNSATSSATAFTVHSENTSGNLFSLINSGMSRLDVAFDGTTTIAGSTNTSLIVNGGRTLFSAATTSYSSLNVPTSATIDPDLENQYDGDLWYNGTNLYFNSTGTLYDLLNTGTVQGSGITGYVAKWGTGTGLTHSQILDAVGLGVTITSLSEGVGSGAGATAYLTIQSVAADQSAEKQYSTYFVRGVKEDGTRMFSVDVSGHLRATTKSFDIPHPTKPGKRLVYGVLEGPEHGVYHRGTVQAIGIHDVNLPNYWSKLVGDNYTIQITPWGNYNIKIINKTDSYFTVGLIGYNLLNKNKSYKFDYIVHGSRKDAPLDIEQ